MTVTSDQRKSGIYAGNGTLDVLPFNFRTLDPAEVAVVVADEQGAESALNPDAYGVALNPSQDSQPGGNVLLNAPLAMGHTAIVVSNVPYDQPLDITNAGGFYPDVLENQLDRTTFQIQQLREELGRTLKIPISSMVAPESVVGEFLAAYGSFLGAYFGPLAQDPICDPKGSPLQPGDAYFNTTTNRVRIYGSEGWFYLDPGAIALALASDSGAEGIGTLSGDTVQGRLDAISAMVEGETLNRAAAVEAEENARSLADSQKANSVDVVHLAEAETIVGEKTFSVVPKILNYPTDPLHAVNKAYASLIAVGFQQKADARAATTAALPSNTYGNGSSGVGATLTASANGPLPSQGGINLSVNQRLWVRHEAAAANNGVYVVTQVGDGSSPYVLTRAADFDAAADMGNASAYVQEGTWAGCTFGVGLASGAITVGTTAIEPVTVQSGSNAVAAQLALILLQLAVEGYAFSFLDGSGLSAGGIKDDGTLHFKKGQIENLLTNTINGQDSSNLVAVAAALLAGAPEGFRVAFIDAIGLAAVGILNDGTLRAARAQIDNAVLKLINGQPIAALLKNEAYKGNYRAEIVQLASYGQSLGEGSQANPPVSTIQEYDSLMFASGVRTQNGGGDRSSVVPLTESTSSDRGETPMSGWCSMVKQLIRDENGISHSQQNYQCLASAPAEGGRTILELSKPGAYYTRFLDDVSGGVACAAALNKSYSFLGYGMTQGEADIGGETSLSTYKTRREAFHAPINTDVKAATGQGNDLQEYFGQTASHRYYYMTAGKASAIYPGIALTQLQLSVDNPRMHLACPMYIFQYAPDKLHLTAASERWYGAYLGLCHKRVEIDGQGWSPVRPIAAHRQGAIVLLKFNVPRRPLVFDTDQVALNGNYGFELVDSSNAPIAITSVTLISPDTIKILAGSAVPVGAKVRYAFTGADQTGPVDGARGNLRDSQGEDIVFDPIGIRKRMDNWCVIFEQTLT